MATPEEIVDDLVVRLNTLGLAVSQATTVSPGTVQLAGDLGGTATAPTVPGKANTTHNHSGQSLTPAQITMRHDWYKVTPTGSLAVFPKDQTTLGTLPFPNEWHDIFVFHNRSTPTLEVSTDGTTFNSGTLTGLIFAGSRNGWGAGTTVDGVSSKGARWTWASNMSWAVNTHAWLAISLPYVQANNPAFSVLVESSADGTTWTPRASTTNVNFQQGTMFLAVADWGGDSRLRVTVTNTSGNSLRVTNMKMFTSRPDYGVNPYQPPMVWDETKKVGIGSGVTATGTANLRLGTDTAYQEGGIQFGSDTYLYRAGANSLKTTGTLYAAGRVYAETASPAAANELTRKDYVDLRELASNKGAANGYAPLDATSKVPAVNLPSYVDDVLEYAALVNFPGTGETGKIYVATGTGKCYRWTGTVYVEVSPSDVNSVAGRTGIVTLTSADLTDSGTTGRGLIATANPTAARSTIGAAAAAQQVIAGTGLTGGGDLSADRTLTVAYGTTSTTACVGNDARLSDTRTPTDSSVTNAKVAAGAAIALSKLATGYVQGSNNGAATTLTVWVGTEAQYTAIGSKDANTLYFRTA